MIDMDGARVRTPEQVRRVLAGPQLMAFALRQATLTLEDGNLSIGLSAPIQI